MSEERVPVNVDDADLVGTRRARGRVGLRLTDIDAGKPLSPRQLQMLQRIAEGDTNEQIAHLYGISAETVKATVRKVLGKMGAASRAHAVAIGFRQGLLS